MTPPPPFVCRLLYFAFRCRMATWTTETWGALSLLLTTTKGAFVCRIIYFGLCMGMGMVTVVVV